MTNACPTADDSPTSWSCSRRWMALGGYWLLLTIGTHWPSTATEHPEQYIDKVAHFFAYATLAWLAAWACEAALRSRFAPTAFGIWAAIAAYGVIDELLQIPVNRSCDWKDWVADITGAAVGLWWFRMRRLLTTDDQT